MSIFRRRQDPISPTPVQGIPGPELEEGIVLHPQGEVESADVASELETQLQPHLEALTDGWEHVYGIYGSRVRSGMGRLAIQHEVSDAIEHGSYNSADGQTPIGRDRRRLQTSISQKHEGMLLSEALLSARLRAMTDTGGIRPADPFQNFAIYDEVGDNDMAKSRTIDFEEVYLVASDLHMTLYEKFLDIEEHTQELMDTVEANLRGDTRTRTETVSWILSRDPEEPEDRILLRTLASAFEHRPELLDPKSDSYVFEQGERIDEYTVDLMLLGDSEDTPVLRDTAQSVRAILRKHGINVDSLSDAALLAGHYDELTPDIQGRMRSSQASLNASIRDSLKSLLAKHRVKMHRIPSENDLKALSTELRSDTTQGAVKKRANKGRVTTNTVKGVIVNSSDVERLEPDYKVCRLVPGGSGSSLRFEGITQEVLGAMITDAVEAAGTEKAGLHADITHAVETVTEHPYTEGSKKVYVKHSIDTGNGVRQVSRRSYAPLRNSSAPHSSSLGNDIRVVYTVVGDKVAVERIFTSHNAYERFLNR